MASRSILPRGGRFGPFLPDEASNWMKVRRSASARPPFLGPLPALLHPYGNAITSSAGVLDLIGDAFQLVEEFHVRLQVTMSDSPILTPRPGTFPIRFRAWRRSRWCRRGPGGWGSGGQDAEAVDGSEYIGLGTIWFGSGDRQSRGPRVGHLDLAVTRRLLDNRDIVESCSARIMGASAATDSAAPSCRGARQRGERTRTTNGNANDAA